MSCGLEAVSSVWAAGVGPLVSLPCTATPLALCCHAFLGLVRRIVRAFLVEEQKVVKKVIKAQGAASKAAA